VIIYFLLGKEARNFKNYNFLYYSYRIFKNLFKINFFLSLFLKSKKINKNFDKDFILHNLRKKFII